jgi:hypothetical protein
MFFVISASEDGHVMCFGRWSNESDANEEALKYATETTDMIYVCKPISAVVVKLEEI